MFSVLCFILQMVLAHVTNKLSSHVTHLTIQVFKDDWIRPSSTTKVNIPSLPSVAGSPSSSLLTRPYSSPQLYKTNSPPVTRGLDRPKTDNRTATNKASTPFMTISPDKTSWWLPNLQSQYLEPNSPNC